MHLMVSNKRKACAHTRHSSLGRIFPTTTEKSKFGCANRGIAATSYYEYKWWCFSITDYLVSVVGRSLINRFDTFINIRAWRLAQCARSHNSIARQFHFGACSVRTFKSVLIKMLCLGFSPLLIFELNQAYRSFLICWPRYIWYKNEII